MAYVLSHNPLCEHRFKCQCFLNPAQSEGGGTQPPPNKSHLYCCEPLQAFVCWSTLQNLLSVFHSRQSLHVVCKWMHFVCKLSLLMLFLIELPFSVISDLFKDLLSKSVLVFILSTVIKVKTSGNP